MSGGHAILVQMPGAPGLPVAPERPDAAIAHVAGTQDGVFSVRQAAESGFSSRAISRRVADGRWERLYPGVYRLGGLPPGWRQSLRGAVLWGSPDAVVSHRAAAMLWDLDGVRRMEVEISLPHQQRATHPALVVHHVRNLRPEDVTCRKGLPVTTLPRTFVDLAQVLSSRDLEIALESALRRGVSLGWIARRVWQLDGRGTENIALLRKLVDERTESRERPDSALEVMALRLIRDSGLPEPELHHNVCEGAYHVAEVDFAYPERKVAIQCVSKRHHSGHRARVKDDDQSSWLASLGWLVLSWRASDLDDRPDELLRRLRNSLAIRARPGS